MLLFILLSTSLSLTAAEHPWISKFIPGKDCSVSIEYTPNVGESLPLLLTGKSKNSFLYPKNGGTVLRIPRAEPIYLACPGENNYIENSGASKEARAVCVKDQIFNINGVSRNFSSLACKYIPRHDTRRIKSPCLGRHTSVAIGFQLNDTFLQTIEVCRDNKTLSTYYTKFRLTKNIGSFQIGYPRPIKWWTGEHFPGLNVQQLYKFETQLDTISKILNSTEIARRYLKKSVQYLSRGHLAAKADFVYGSQQRATFWFINAAPQWQSFNGGNWNTLEDAVRQFAARRDLDLDVYTGVHGQMTMRDARGKQQPIHLHYSNRRRALSVPKFFWKIMYDPLSKRGTAFVGLNDPFIMSITTDVYICKDISQSIKWLTWLPKNINKGISYACEIDDLRKAVPTLPPLNVIGVLI